MRKRIFILLLFALPTFADFRERYNEGQFAQALTELEQSPEAGLKKYSYYLNRGLIHHALNQDPLAVAYLSKAKVLAEKDDADPLEVVAPLAEATAGLVKWLGLSRLDSTSYEFETLGDLLPLEALFFIFGVLSCGVWMGYFFTKKYQHRLMKLGLATIALAGLFGIWNFWNEQHPFVIMTESRLIKSGPGETFLDRGAVEPGMKLRIVGSATEIASASPERRWWKVRFNERHDLGYLPEQSGLLLTDESNTPGL